MVAILLPNNIQLEENIFMPPCAFAYNVQTMSNNCKMSNVYDYEDLVIRDLRG
jgi:hypothetical protein